MLSMSCRIPATRADAIPTWPALIRTGRRVAATLLVAGIAHGCSWRPDMMVSLTAWQPVIGLVLFAVGAALVLVHLR